MLENTSMFPGSLRLGFRMFLTSGNYQTLWCGQIPHVSRESPLSLIVLSEDLPVFLKHFLTPGQGASGYSLGFSTSDHWVINTGLDDCLITCHNSGREFSMQGAFKVCS